MNHPPRRNLYLDPTNKQHRDYTRLDVSHSPDNVPDTPFNSPTAMSLEPTNKPPNPFSLNQVLMEQAHHRTQSSPHHPPTSAPTSRDRAASSGSEASDTTSTSQESPCGDEDGDRKRHGDEEMKSSAGFGMSGVLRDEGLERGRCRTRTNSSSSREKKRRLNV